MLLLATLALAAPLQEPSVKDLFDQQLALLRTAQRQDGSYGARTDTAWILTAMALCPRSYREDDGPFMRDAVRWLLAEEPLYQDPAGDAAAALALQCLDSQRYAAQVKALAARAGVPAEAIAALAQTGAPPSGEGPWRDGLPLPAAGMRSLDQLQAIPETAGVPVRAGDVARAALAYRREQASRKAPVDAAAVYERGVDYLLAARDASGLWEVYGNPEPGISALAAHALLRSARADARKAAEPVLDWLKAQQKEDGSIYTQGLPVYVTSAAVMALAAAGRPQDRDALQRALQYLRVTQCDEGENYSESDKFYGGIGYGNDLRPDLSNLQYALAALHAGGATADDPAFQRALVFVQRCQNRSETNPETYRDAGGKDEVRSGNDGGGVYYPGNSMAGTEQLADGTVIARSYGSMSYALLKCYLLAGLPADDARVQAVLRWIQDHWTLEVNPGFDTLRDPRAGYQGLYYYYLTLAETLALTGRSEIRSSDGAAHDWRAELRAKLAALQQPDGSWVNALADRWMEGNAVLCTAYALNALAEAAR
ncbi:MAG: hypothetical protein EYC70_11810 [Planctomycetota bacterium]|nr:MAG: hypothetical protein EYC70_11810 [Planctomycetota bacterium]